MSKNLFPIPEGLLHFFLLRSMVVFLGLCYSLPGKSLDLTAIDFYQDGEVSRLELTLSDQGVKAKRFHVTEDKQIILDLEGVTATPRVMRAFDTSEFSGSVVFVSPYKKPGSENDLRLAIQLRDNVRSVLEIQGTRLMLSIENRFGVFTQKKLEDNLSSSKDISFGQGEAKVRIPKSDSIEDILENLTLSGIKKYVGKKISFNVKDISYVDLLKMIADSSGFNIILNDDISKLPRTTLALTNIPWDQALDTVLSIGKLVASKNGNILIINTLERAQLEARAEAEAKQMSEAKVPLVTKIFPISFAKIDELKTLLKEYSTKDRGVINSDQRTNALIIKDTADVIEKMKKIIETLDTQTPQILIEAKVVEATENYSKEIGLKEGVSFGYDPIAGPTDTPEGPGFAFSSAPVSGDGGRDLFSFGVASYRRLLNLNLRLQLMENESKGKVISSPRIITENKRPATISSTETTSFAVSTTTGTSTSQSFDKISTSLTLSVTPQVTNEGSIVMEVSLSKGSFGARPSPTSPPDTTSRTVNTNILVDNGSTIVLGGIYNFVKTESVAGIPFLKDLPLVGWLFRTAWNPAQSKTELIIFLTPRIINQEEAGLVERDEALL